MTSFWLASVKVLSPKLWSSGNSDANLFGVNRISLVSWILFLALKELPGKVHCLFILNKYTKVDVRYDIPGLLIWIPRETPPSPAGLTTAYTCAPGHLGLQLRILRTQTVNESWALGPGLTAWQGNSLLSKCSELSSGVGLVDLGVSETLSWNQRGAEKIQDSCDSQGLQKDCSIWSHEKLHPGLE